MTKVEAQKSRGKCADEIRRNRRRLDLTQEQLAMKLFISVSTVGNWEQGKSEPDIHMLRKLSKLFNIRMEDMVDDDS